MADTHFAHVKRNIVKNHDHLFGRKLVEAHCFDNSLTAVVHIGRGLHQQDFFVAELCFDDKAFEFDFVDLAAALVGNIIKSEPAAVVARLLVFFVGITQSYYNIFNGT